MLFLKYKYLFLILISLLLPFSLRAAWTEPASAPPGGNVGVPVYSAGGVAQTIDSSLTVGAVGTATTLQGAGSSIGVQGSSPQYAVYGATTAGAPSGYAGVFGTAADATDFSGNFSGGAGIAIQGGTITTLALPTYVLAAQGQIVSTGGYALGGNISFNTRNLAVSSPHITPGYGDVGIIKVDNSGETQIRSLGAGINFMKVTGASPGTLTSLLTISEAGVVNVAAGGSLTVNTTPVCLQSGSGCPAQTTPNLQAVTTAGNTTTQDATFGNYVWVGTGNRVRVGEIYGNNGLHTVNTMQFNSAQAGTAFKWTYNNNDLMSLSSGADLRLEGRVGINMAPASGAKLWIAQTAAVEGLKIYQTGSSPKYSPISAVDVGGGDVFRVTENGDVKLIKDIYLNNGKSLRVDDNGANTSLVIGNYGESGTFSYGTGRTASLAVEGDVRGNQLCMQGDCKGSWSQVSNAGGWTDLGANVALITSTDNVGIGRNDPGYKLDVSGDLRVSGGGAFGNYSPDATHKVTTPTFYTTRAEIGPVTGGLPGQDGDLNAKRLCIQGDCKANWAAVANSSGWTDSGTNVTPTAVTDLFSVGTITPTINYSLTVDSGPNIAAMLAIGAVDIASGNLRVMSGSVGIGSANNPGYRLDVVDNNNTSIINLNSDDAANYWTGMRLARQGNEKWFVGVDNSTDKLLLRRNNSSNDVVIDTAGKVGVGVTPTARLHVKPVGNEEGIRVISGLWSPLIIRNTADSSDLLRVDQNGNVGIGVAPTRKFQIFGDMGAGAGEFLAVIESPNDDANLALVTGQTSGDYAVVGFRRGPVYGLGWNAGLGPTDNNFRIQSRPVNGPNTDRLVIDQATGAVNAVNSLCIGGNCKSGNWGAVAAAYGVNGGDAGQNPAIPGVREYTVMTVGFDDKYYYCQPGFVVIGFRNKNPGELICGKMW